MVMYCDVYTERLIVTIISYLRYKTEGNRSECDLCYNMVQNINIKVISEIKVMSIQQVKWI